jgi:hypothetical protein
VHELPVYHLYVYGAVPNEDEAVRLTDCPLLIEGAGGDIATVGGELTVNRAGIVVIVDGVAELSVTLAQ